MTIKKLILAVGLSALAAVYPLSAKHSDDFALGVYSSLSNSTPESRAIRESLCKLMRDLGYNATMMNTNNSDTDLAGLLAEMESYGLDAVLNDFSFGKAPQDEFRFASHRLSISNYLRFEAEFSGEGDVKPGDGLDNQFWYAMGSEKGLPRVGKAVSAKGASYGWAWQAKAGKDKTGYLFTDPRYRWPNRNGAYIRFGADFLLDQNDPGRLADDYIWVKHRFKITNVRKGLSPDEPLLRFDLAGYELSGSGFSSAAKALSHLSPEGEGLETLYRVSDHARSDSAGDFVELELKVKYSRLLEEKLLTRDHDLNSSTPDSGTRLRLINLNPRVYWYGNCDVVIDYVEIEDQIHHDLTSDSDYWREGVTRRIQSIMAQSGGNLKALYAFDEPLRGHFDSFRVLQEIAARSGIGLMTAIFEHERDNVILDKEDQVLYSHVDAFRKLAKPRIISPDVYPLIPELAWDKASGGKGVFIQDMLDDELLRIYRECKQYRDAQAGRSFYPIVQVLGNWDKIQGREQWQSWIKPPLATQKALLYLPLCFGPDGIFHYSLRVTQNTDGFGYRGISFSRQGSKEYPHPVNDPVSWAAVSSSNHRVLEYGKIVKNLAWQGSETIGTAAGRTGGLQTQALLNDARVKESGNGDYEGYVQCGYFQGEGGLPYYMLVNRRGNYFRPGTHTEPRFVPETEFDAYFPAAEPQTLILEFSPAAIRKFGRNLALYDPFDHTFHPCTGNKLELPLPAGEGRLLQLVGILPARTTGKVKIKGDAILSGEIELKKGSKVVLDKSSRLILLPGTRLVVDPKSRLYLYGKVTLLGDAQIIVRGKLKNKARKLVVGPQAAIIGQI